MRTELHSSLVEVPPASDAKLEEFRDERNFIGISNRKAQLPALRKEERKTRRQTCRSREVVPPIPG